MVMEKHQVWDDEKGKWHKDKHEFIPRRAHSGPFAAYRARGVAARYTGDDDYIAEVETDDFLPMECSLDEQIKHAEGMMLRWGERLAELEKKAKNAG
jgi:hypothetical protein